MGEGGDSLSNLMAISLAELQRHMRVGESPITATVSATAVESTLTFKQLPLAFGTSTASTDSTTLRSTHNSIHYVYDVSAAAWIEEKPMEANDDEAEWPDD
jgi:hypothetical protein